MAQNSVAYFAHPMCYYGTDREAEIITHLKQHFDFEVINPGDPTFQAMHERNVGILRTHAESVKLQAPSFDKDTFVWQAQMSLFEDTAKTANHFVFAAFENQSTLPDSTASEDPRPRIGAGVYKEFLAFKQTHPDGSAIFLSNAFDELDNNQKAEPILIQTEAEFQEKFRVLSVEETIALLEAAKNREIPNL
jgi:hypothetical protein